MQGWFSPTRARVETIENGPLVLRDYPPGRTSGQQIAENALHATGNSPEQLRYYAFTTDQPRQLWDFRGRCADRYDVGADRSVESVALPPIRSHRRHVPGHAQFTPSDVSAMAVCGSLCVLFDASVVYAMLDVRSRT
ncbi:hypothetical protein AW168_33215 [Nocardia brasiliensis]|uniref:Uncharacterized protein n=1 Tax=Nocardia brasiliensis (strain ATCC 700358 / HUJEG-1) TaxID=1133849 RepID=K0F684_NOCB7|nr:hypothetical protein O3I_025000 [Nocardia brasiliensis ATCC 700358]OCF86023.1 hypothetical protein AW168_33215 [Nocardia brasiliensis]